MDPIAITGLGAVTTAGVGGEALASGLFAGRTLVRALPELPATGRGPAHGAPVTEMGAHERIPAARLRRMGRLSRMATVAAYDALSTSAPPERQATGVVIGTGFGALDETIAFLEQLREVGAAEATPALFPASVMNVAAAHVSIELGLHGYNTTVNHKETSGELALYCAESTLALGHAPRLVVIGVDELGPSLQRACGRLGALASGEPRPYLEGRDGFVLGEGACAFVLEPLAEARARGAGVLALLAGLGAAGGERPLAGWGPAPEAGRVLGPDLAAGVEAVERALEDARIGADAVDLVVGCGCGSPSLDRLDAEVLARVFHGRAVPVSSPHGAFGCWAAAGALRVAAGVLALGLGELFPTVGEGSVDPTAPLPGLVRSARRAELRAVLVTGHATGGASSAVVLTRED
jgi:3-oxoacyl-(acyl-carrier-protein) synthase